MMGSMIESYRDVFCTVREEYAKELEAIKSDGEFIEFSDFSGSSYLRFRFIGMEI